MASGTSSFIEKIVCYFNALLLLEGINDVYIMIDASFYR